MWRSSAQSDDEHGCGIVVFVGVSALVSGDLQSHKSPFGGATLTP